MPGNTAAGCTELRHMPRSHQIVAPYVLDSGVAQVAQFVALLSHRSLALPCACRGALPTIIRT